MILIPQKVTAIYCRLSKDDEKIGESVSIETQKLLLQRFCEEQGFESISVYVDDGFSGLSFNRPGFQRLLSDIESGRIQTVITKDLSRLGRDYIQTGYYIDYYFKERDIRYIAVNDNVDTLREDNDIAPFKNILNDLYARDLSRKVKSAKRLRALKGYFISGQAPHGYKTDPQNHNHLVIDEEAKTVIQNVFQFASQGKTLREIAAILTGMKIPTPGAYKALHGDNRFHRFLHEKNYVWCSATIAKLLRDPVYIGHMVNHKDEVKNYKTKERRSIPQQDRIVVENTHEPIISQELFHQVQEIMTHKAHVRRYQFDNVFEGCVFCGECGHKMTQATKKSQKGIRFLLRCTFHFSHPDQCRSNHAIFYDMLLNTVTEELKKHWDEEGVLYDTSPLTKNEITRWIDYIEIGRATLCQAGASNQVIIHYQSQSKGKNQKRAIFPGAIDVC